MVQTGFRNWRNNVGEIIGHLGKHWISDEILGTSIFGYTGSEDNGTKGYQTRILDIFQQIKLPNIQHKNSG